jgi:hypothetical protein
MPSYRLPPRFNPMPQHERIKRKNLCDINAQKRRKEQKELNAQSSKSVETAEPEPLLFEGAPTVSAIVMAERHEYEKLGLQPPVFVPVFPKFPTPPPPPPEPSIWDLWWPNRPSRRKY